MSGSPQRSSGWVLAGVFVLALVLRLVALGQYESAHPLADRPVIDEASYEEWAVEIAAGDWLGDEIFFQEPLYPYAMAVVHAVAPGELEARRHTVRVVQCVLGALTAVLVALLAGCLFGRDAGLFAGLVFALYRPGIWFPSLLLKPNLFVPLLCGLCLVLLRTRRTDRVAMWWLVGLLAALGSLLRGNMLVLLPCFVLWPVARAVFEQGNRKRALGSALAVVVGIVCVLLPVALRNQAVGGQLVLTTSGAGTNLYGGNNVDNPYGIATEFDWVRGIPPYEADDWRHEAERRLGRELDPTEVSGYWRDEVFASIAADPLLHARIFWNKLRLTLGGYEVPDNHFIEWDARWVPLVAAPLPGFALGGGLGLAGLVAFLILRARRVEAGPDERTAAALELACVFALYLATIVLTVTSARVRLALVPLLLPFAGWFVLRARSLFADPRGRLAAVVGVVIAAALVFVPVLPASKRAEDFDERDFNLAGGWIDAASHLDEAETLLRGLAAKHPDSARVQRRLSHVEYLRARDLIARHSGDTAALLEVQARVEAALERLFRIVEHSNPRESFRAAALAGFILQEQAQWEHAARLYRRALEFDPGDGDLTRRLALVLAESAMQQPPGPERSALLLEAERLLDELLERDPSAGVEGLLTQIRARF